MGPLTITTSYKGTEKFEELPSGFHVPRRYTVEIDDPRRGVFLTLRVVFENGQPVCDEMTVKRTGPGTLAGDERYPLKSYLKGTLASVATRVRKGQSGRRAPLRPEDVDEFYTSLGGTESVPVMQRRRVDRDRLIRVADLYRTAVEDGRSPAPIIAEVLGGAQPLGKSYARRLVMMARREGLLGPARRGKAGESEGAAHAHMDQRKRRKGER